MPPLKKILKTTHPGAQLNWKTQEDSGMDLFPHFPIVLFQQYSFTFYSTNIL